MIVNNERLFARAILLDSQISVLSESVASLRSNRNERIGEKQVVQILQEIEGQEGDKVQKITGLKPLLFGQIEMIKQEVNKLREGYFGKGILVETMT